MLQGRPKAVKPELRTRAVFDDGMVGRVTASQIASASAASFFWLLT